MGNLIKTYDSGFSRLFCQPVGDKSGCGKVESPCELIASVYIFQASSRKFRANIQMDSRCAPLSLIQVMEISDHNLRTMFFVSAPILKQSNDTPSVKDL